MSSQFTRSVLDYAEQLQLQPTASTLFAPLGLKERHRLNFNRLDRPIEQVMAECEATNSPR